MAVLGRWRRGEIKLRVPEGDWENRQLAAQLLAALLETATAVIELVSLLKGRKSPEGSEIDTGREE